MNFFDLDKYTEIIKFRINQYPKRGYGVLKKIADYLQVNSTFISQVMNGTKTLNLEQASLLCEFFGLTKLETKYFLLLVQHERAGNKSLKKNISEQISEIKIEAGKISNRLPVESKLTETDKATFYSRWYYCAVRQMTALPHQNSPDIIADSLRLPRKVVVDAIQFLTKSGLIKEENNKFAIGPRSTHLNADSPLIKMHHINWRSKAMDLFDQDHPQKLHYTSPMTLSKRDVQKIRSLLLDAIEKIASTVDNSQSEEFYCINIDWFKVSKLSDL